MSTCRVSVGSEARRQAAYRQARLPVLRAAGYKCQQCGSKDRLELDHIDPSKKKVEATRLHQVPVLVAEQERQKLQVLCKSCHAKKTAQDQRRKYRGPIVSR